jgi:Na+-translocating ferredoxin:NAD+ oxidoreductase subunit B
MEAMKKLNITVEAINDALPQTQCGLCTYDGCKPYAEAIVNDGDAINRCPPGGVRGLKKLASLTEQDPTPFIEEMKKEEKPRMIAVIREDECIGCVKCIKACPVDAIIGSAKTMHTVITNECNGCELCIEPCPVDCIDMIEIGKVEDLSENEAYKKAKHYRKRYEFREERLERIKTERRKKHLKAKVTSTNGSSLNITEKKKLIAEAIARSKAKK